MKSTPNLSAIPDKVSSCATVYRKGAEAVGVEDSVIVGVMLAVRDAVGVWLGVSVIVEVGVSLAKMLIAPKPPEFIHEYVT